MSTISIPHRSYLLPTPILVQIKDQCLIGIKYYSDCVFKPHIFDINFTVRPAEKKESQQSLKQQSHVVQMDFNFLIQQTKRHPKILDNLGILNFSFQTKQDQNPKIDRLGILITNEKGDLYVSLVL